VHRPGVYAGMRSLTSVPSPVTDSTSSEPPMAVADIACGLIALAVDARPELRRAPRERVAAEIAAAAAEHDCDLVVLGSRGRSDLGGLLPGGVAREVVERVRCPRAAGAGGTAGVRDPPDGGVRTLSRPIRPGPGAERAAARRDLRGLQRSGRPRRPPSGAATVEAERSPATG
jgi:Universal stress protein family